MSCSFVFVLRVCERLTTHSLISSLAKWARSKDLQFRPLTLAMQQSLRSINKAIRASVAEFISSLADNLTQVMKDRLSGFTKRFPEEIAKIMPQSASR